VTDGTRRLQEAGVVLDRTANGRRWLIESFGSLDIGRENEVGFIGRRHQVEFSTWSENGRGWNRRTRLIVVLDDGRLVARSNDGQSLMLVDSVLGVEFDYLLEPGSRATWVSEWVSATAPLAVRIRIDRRSATDTLLLLVGARG
jgi:hypothetical protein